MLPELDWLRPAWLLALAVLPWWLWRLGGERAAEDHPLANDLVDPQLLPYLIGDADAAPHPPPRWALPLAATLVVLALAGPRAVVPDTAVTAPGQTRIVVADLSPAVSGDAARLAALQRALDALLARLPAGDTGLVVYAGEAYTVAPLTTDTATLRRFVPELRADVMPVAGDDPAAALAHAAGLLPAGRGQIVWLTAGAGPLPDAVLGAGRQLFVLGLDTAAPIDALAALAGHHGGVAVPGRADGGELDVLLAALNAAPLVAAPTSAGRGREVGPWLLLLSLLPLALAAGVPRRRRAAALWLVALMLPLLGPPRPAAAADRPPPADRADDSRWQAVAAYRAGDYAAAVRLLQNAGDASSHYNRGNALVHLGDFAGAIAAYDAALAIDPADADARHNRDLLRPPPPPDGARPPPPPPATSAADAEAGRIAAQWLRGVPDDPGSLLQRKLAAEHARRQRAGASAR